MDTAFREPLHLTTFQVNRQGVLFRRLIHELNVGFVSGCFVADSSILQCQICVWIGMTMKARCLTGSKCQVINANLLILKDQDVMFLRRYILRAQRKHANSEA